MDRGIIILNIPVVDRGIMNDIILNIPVVDRGIMNIEYTGR